MKTAEASFNLSEDLKLIVLSKLKISKEICNAMEEKGVNLKRLSKKTKIKKKELRKIFMGENYKIETLLKVVHFLEIKRIKI